MLHGLVMPESQRRQGCRQHGEQDVLVLGYALQSYSYGATRVGGLRMCLAGLTPSSLRSFSSIS